MRSLRGSESLLNFIILFVGGILIIKELPNLIYNKIFLRK